MQILTVSVVQVDLHGNVRFTTVPFKALADQVYIRYQRFVV